MMREGKATVYAGPPTWDPVETLAGYKFTTPRMFLVGRCLPGEADRMAVAFWQPEGKGWTLDEEGTSRLPWTPLYMALPPALPPWPAPDHPEMQGRLD